MPGVPPGGCGRDVPLKHQKSPATNLGYEVFLLDPGPRIGRDSLMTALLGGGCGVAEHLPESAHQHRMRWPTLGQREKVVDPEALRTTRCLAIRMGARMD